MATKLDPFSSTLVSKYDKSFKEFGIDRITTEIKNSIDHRFFRRNIVVGHRDFDKILECIKQKKPFINVTGIASSDVLHFGHKEIIDAFVLFKKLGGRSYFAVCDVDAYVSRPDSKIPTLKQAQRNSIDNVANALSLGVDPSEIYIQSRREKEYFTLSHMFTKKLTPNTFEAAYGELNFGKFSSALLQIADILSPQLKHLEGPMPTIIPVGPDQDPPIRLMRDIARKLQDQFNFVLPSTIYLSHQPGLVKGHLKMSKSIEGSSISLIESPKEVNRKVDNAFTGGRDSLEEQKEKGGEPDICMVYTFLKFHNPDEKLLLDIYRRCRSGELICGDCKQKLKDFINNFIKQHKKKYDKNVEIAKKMFESAGL